MVIPSLSGQVLKGCEICIAEWSDDGSYQGPIAPLHLHRTEDEAWYVLEGTLGIRIGDAEIEVHAGGIALAPKGELHTYWNAGGDTLRYLLIMGPKTASLIEAIHQTDDRSRDAMAALFAKFDAELV